MKPANILVVDDKEVITDLLSTLIKNMGHNCVRAENGLSAFEKFCEQSFDIIITDLIMPGMKGEELVKKIRERDKEVIIIVITGYATIEAAIPVMKEGAFDFIKKPFHINEIKMIIDKAVEFHNIREKNRKYSETLNIAQGLRDKLLYRSTDRVSGLNIGYETIFLDELGGDIYNLLPLDNDNILIYMGDVSYRGVNACLLSSMVYSIINETVTTETSPQGILTRLNKSLSRYLGEESVNFVTLLIIRINLLTNEIICARAGHSTPLIYQNKSIIKFQNQAEAFLGMFPDVIYTQEHKQLQTGDRIVLFTDGLPESRNPQGEMLGTKRIEQIIGENEHLCCQTLAQKLGEEARSFLDGTPLKDDISIMVLDITGERAEEALPIEALTTHITKMKIPSILKYRKGIVSRVLSLANNLGMSNERLNDLRLVLDEAIINAIEHGNRMDQNKLVRVYCKSENDYLVMSVKDEGGGFDPDSLPPANQDSFSSRGRGLFLIKQFADEVRHNEKGNEITIGFSLGE